MSNNFLTEKTHTFEVMRKLSTWLWENLHSKQDVLRWEVEKKMLMSYARGRKERATNFNFLLLIHSADPQSRPVVITIFARGVCTSVRLSVQPHFSKSSKTKQLSSENSDRYWMDCGCGRGDHWWHLSCRSLPLRRKILRSISDHWRWLSHHLNCHFHLELIAKTHFTYYLTD